MKLIFEICWKICREISTLTRKTGTLHEEHYKDLIISRSVLLTIRNVRQICRENQNAHFILNKSFFSKNRAVCEIMWRKMLEPDRPQMRLRCMHIACWIPKTTNTHLNCVILCVFPLQKWLHERASVLRYV